MIFTKKRIRFLITACSAVSLSVLTSCDIFMAEWKKSGFYDQAENAAAEEEAKLKAEAEAKAKAEAERLANPTTEDLLKSILEELRKN